MALLSRFTPPGNLDDLGARGLTLWDTTVESYFAAAIADNETCTNAGRSQFVDPRKSDVAAYQSVAIDWPAFPNALTLDHPGEDGYRLADQRGVAGRDLQDEYLEWFVHRDASGDVVRIDFTCENPQYWTVLVASDPDRAVALYQRYVDPSVKLADLVDDRNQYDPDNRWNVDAGAMHLRQPNNNLFAEIEIAAGSTISRTQDGELVTDGGQLCELAGLGERRRHSDPHIVESVNAKAHEGRFLSLRDPVGLYMKPPNFAGFVTPDGSDPAACWHVERGNPTVRARFEAPPGTFKIGDVTIGGDKIKYGGQVAERVHIFLTGLFTSETNAPVTTVDVRRVCAVPRAAGQQFAFTAAAALPFELPFTRRGKRR
jgi:hypothetical protein